MSLAFWIVWVVVFASWVTVEVSAYYFFPRMTFTAIVRRAFGVENGRWSLRRLSLLALMLGLTLHLVFPGVKLW